MKFLVVLVAFVGVCSAQGFRRAQQVAPRPSRGAASSDQAASILRNEVDITPEGTYSYAYETDNGIAGQEQGSAGGAQGSFSWTSPEGQPIAISYSADADGYHPSGDALPTPPSPPPIPPQIARALEWLAKNAKPEYQQ